MKVVVDPLQAVGVAVQNAEELSRHLQRPCHDWNRHTTPPSTFWRTTTHVSDS